VTNGREDVTMDELQRLIKLVSDTTALAIWKDLCGYKSLGDADDRADARMLRLEVEDAIEGVYGMTADDFEEYVLELEETRN
jgi:hypothetical protein